MSRCSEFFWGTRGALLRSVLLVICIPNGIGQQNHIDRTLDFERTAKRFASYGQFKTPCHGVQVRPSTRQRFARVRRYHPVR